MPKKRRPIATANPNRPSQASWRKARRYRQPKIKFEINAKAIRLFQTHPTAMSRCVEKHFATLRNHGVIFGEPKAGSFLTDCVVQGNDIIIKTHLTTGVTKIDAF